MEAYSSSYYPTSKSSYLSQQNSEERNKGLNFQSHSSMLHSVRKTQSKPWKKAPVAPPPSSRIRVYEVDVMNFRDLVQQLTGAPEFKPQLQDHSSSRDIAAAPSAVSNEWYQQGVQSQEISGRTNKLPGLLELNLSSPSSYSWGSSLP